MSDRCPLGFLFKFVRLLENIEIKMNKHDASHMTKIVDLPIYVFNPL